MFRQAFSGIGRYISSIEFKRLFTYGLLLSSGFGNAASANMRAPRNTDHESGDNGDTLALFGSMPGVNIPTSLDPSQIALWRMNGLPSDEKSKEYISSLGVTDEEGDDDWDEEYESDVEQTADEELESDEKAGTNPKRIEPRAADINHVPGNLIHFTNGTYVDMSCSLFADTCLVVSFDGNINAQTHNSTDPQQRSSEIGFNGASMFQVTDYDDGYAIVYRTTDGFINIRMITANGTGIRNVHLPLSVGSSGASPKIVSTSNSRILVGFEETAPPTTHYQMVQLIGYDGSIIGDRIIVTLDDDSHYSCALSVSGTIIVDVYDNEQISLSCKFIRTTDAYLSSERSVLSDGTITEISSHDVKFGNSDEFVVVAAVTESSLPKVYALFGHTTSDFFTECTFSNRAVIPDIYYGPIEVRYVGEDRDGLSLFDIVGRDFAGKLIGVQCWYNNSTDTPEFSSAETIAENIQGSSTAIDRLGRLWRGFWTTANEIFIQPFTCTPVPCAATPADIQSYPSESSSSSIPQSSVPASSDPSSASPPPDSSTSSPVVISDPTGASGPSSSENTGDSSGAVVSSVPNSGDLSGNSEPDSASNSTPLQLSSEQSADNNSATLIAALCAIFGTLAAVGAIAGGVFVYLRKRSPYKEVDIELSDLELIGQGGYGTVFKKVLKIDIPRYGLKVGDQIAIKELPSKLAELSDYVDEFVKEAKRIQECNHPNIIKCFWYSVSPRCFMVLPYYPKGSLAKILKSDELSWSVLFSIIKGITKGLAYLHHGKNPAIIHRDIKPENILIADDMTPVITDFGTGKEDVTAHTKTLTRGIGTPLYIAPEVLESKYYSNKADVYSYGILLWVMYAKREPYMGYDAWRLAAAVIAGTRPEIPPYPTLLSGDETVVTREVNYIKGLMPRCWAALHRDRPAMDQVAQELESLASGTNSQVQSTYS